MRRTHLLFIFMALFGTQLEATSFLPFGSFGEVRKEPRSYEVGLDSDQYDDLRFVLTALAYNPFSVIWADRVRIQEAMMNIDDVHPLNFITAIFLDKELTECIHIIRDKQWLWCHFSSRVKRILDEELERDNMRPEYVQSFCDELNLECDTVLNCMMEHQWDWLIDHLFEKFSREKNNQ